MGWPKIVYYFKDTSDPATCAGNVCQTMEKWYDDYPQIPHAGRCDCPILTYFALVEYVYKNFKAEAGGELTYESADTTSYPNPHPTEELDASVSISIKVKRTVKVDVTKVMEYFGLSASVEEERTVTRSCPVKIPPMHEAIITATISGRVTHYTAEEWAVWSYNYLDDGWDIPEGGELFIQDIQGGTLYEESADVDFDVEYIPL